MSLLGLRILNSAKMKMSDNIGQLWMVPFLPQKASAGLPMFWLPFQDPATGNHIAQWTEAVERQPCTPGDVGACPSDEVCKDGECKGAPIY